MARQGKDRPKLRDRNASQSFNGGCVHEETRRFTSRSDGSLVEIAATNRRRSNPIRQHGEVTVIGTNPILVAVCASYFPPSEIFSPHGTLITIESRTDNFCLRIATTEIECDNNSSEPVTMSIHSLISGLIVACTSS